MLVRQDVYFSSIPPASEGVAQALLSIAQRARASGWPIKVAIIATPSDLGDFARLFATPQRYAVLLARAIGDPRLLVVTPDGFAGQKLGDGVNRALAPLGPVKPGDDRLERQALTAVARLASAAGHPLAVPSVDTSERGKRPHPPDFTGHAQSPAGTHGPATSRRGTTDDAASPLLYVAPLALLLLLIGGRSLHLRRIAGTERQERDEPASRP